MKVFEQPSVKVIEFEVKDIITASSSDSSVAPIDPELPGDDFE